MNPMNLSREYLETVHKPICYGLNPNDTCLCVLKELCEEALINDPLSQELIKKASINNQEKMSTQ